MADKMRVVVTGGRGMLGTDVCERFSRGGAEVVPVTTQEFDIADYAQTRVAIGDLRPDLIVHTAAQTDVDGCERDPDAAYRVNAIGTWHVASAAAEFDSRLAIVSTDFVFDGAKGAPYTEFDSPNPLGAYGASKLAGETLARQACKKLFTIRTSWLFGVHGKCFPRTILRLAETRPEFSVVADQFGSPTFSADLADEIYSIVHGSPYGTFHVANNGESSWYEFAVGILEAFGITGVTIKPIKTHEWPSPTLRPAYSVLRPYVRELQGNPPLRHWRDALADFAVRVTVDREES